MRFGSCIRLIASALLMSLLIAVNIASSNTKFISAQSSNNPINTTTQESNNFTTNNGQILNYSRSTENDLTGISKSGILPTVTNISQLAEQPALTANQKAFVENYTERRADRSAPPLPSETPSPTERTSELPLAPPTNLVIPSVNTTTTTTTANATTAPKATTNKTSTSPVLALSPQPVNQNFTVYGAKQVKLTEDVFTSTVDEPSVANNGVTVFFCGNWYCARSEDGGSNWITVSPYSDMGFYPNGNPKFCCDQDIVFDPKDKMFVWYRQAVEDPVTGQGFFRLGISSDANHWFNYDVYPTNVSNILSIHDMFDLPQLTLSDKYLYIKSNIYQSNLFKGTIFIRWLLDDLKNNAPAKFDFYIAKSGGFNYVPVQGAKNKMYFAAQLSNIRMRIYEWDEGSPSPKPPFDVTIDPTILAGQGQMNCASPGGFNWCARADYRMLGGIYQNGSFSDGIGKITFFWNAGQGGDFQFPHVDAATFRTSDMAYVSRPLLWSSQHAWLYSFAHPNPKDNSKIGITAFAGSGSIPYPSIAVGTNNVKSGIGVSPWNIQPAITGTNAPGNNKWGDYLRIRPHSGSGEDWISSGYILKGGTSSNQIQPIYLVFGFNSSKISNATGIAQKPGNIISTTTTTAIQSPPPGEQKLIIRATDTRIPGSEYIIEVNNTQQLEQQLISLIQSSSGAQTNFPQSFPNGVDPTIRSNVENLLKSLTIPGLLSSQKTPPAQGVADILRHVTISNGQICTTISWFRICVGLATS
jgi:hypothetical protein